MRLSEAEKHTQMSIMRFAEKVLADIIDQGKEKGFITKDEVANIVLSHSGENGFDIPSYRPFSLLHRLSHELFFTHGFFFLLSSLSHHLFHLYGFLLHPSFTKLLDPFSDPSQPSQPFQPFQPPFEGFYVFKPHPTSAETKTTSAEKK